MPDGSDDDLMRLAGAGDKAAFGRLVERHFVRTVALAGRIVRNRSDAEEIVQEAFMRAWIKASDWQPRGERAGAAAFSTWLYRVVVNLCIDRGRRPVEAPIEAADDIADPNPGAEEQLVREQTSRRVAAAMARLPERQRAALALCHYDAMSNIEAAEALQISVGALESLLVRARRALRSELADLAQTPETVRSSSWGHR